MSHTRIAQALTKLFGKYRIVFWYDSERELRAEFAALELPGVEKVELDNNEFGVKHRILRQQPEQQFLLYRHGPQAADPLANWLLDVQLAHGEFRTDQVGLWLAELELPVALSDLLREHTGFFDAAKRREALKKLLAKDDTHGQLRMKMLAVCAGISEPRLDVVLEHLLEELAGHRDEKIKLIARSGLSDFLWQQMQRSYGYASPTPGVHDFAIELFKSCFAMGIGQPAQLSAEALVFLRRWKDSRRFAGSFEALSEQSATTLGLQDRLHGLDARELLELDYFELIDRKILSDLVAGVSARTLTTSDIGSWVRQRRQSHWYERFRDLYSAVEMAAEFFFRLDAAQLQMDSLADGIHKYTQHWFRLDQLYRKYVYHARESGQASLLAQLSTQVENLYSTNYLLRLNDRWQPLVDAAPLWDAPPIVLQRNFYRHWVKPFVDRKTKVCVLISDAFRYEIGEELQSLIRQEDKLDASLEPALSMLPSYTQLGMASLLPNTVIALADDGSGNALVDGQSAQGTPNRAKILAATVPASAAVQAKDVMEMGREDVRALVRDNEVVYVYHNLIDKTGDTRDTEERVFAAAEETLQELLRLIKKLTGNNASNLLVTADHGFIYQHRPIEESDFLTGAADGQEVLYRDRRFVLGRGLHPNPGLRTFTPAQLGLGGALEVQIPKSINRLRLQGSGSRFVHGGATLQEVVIPVLKVKKKRQSDVSRVEVELISGGGKTITTGQLAVTLYQAQAVTDKLQSRRLRVGIYNLQGELISDSHELLFDLAAESPRDREFPLRLLLSRQADAANNQQVTLRLEEPVEGTSHHQEYKAVRYSIRRSFTSEFDF
ncbi:BREX-1 system phosphatase PglZ type A [Luteimonas sp. A501]